MAAAPTSEMLLCPTCGKSYPHRSSWRRYVRGHSQLGIYHCCGKSFQDADHLSRHRAAQHDGPKVYVCPTCSKEYATQHQLNEHQRVERRENFVKCDTCAATFANTCALAEHVATHTGERKHVCACGKAFRHKSSLSRHRRTHKND